MQTQHSHCASHRIRPDGVALNLLASALTILTALALLGTTAVLRDSSAPVAGSERHDPVIHAFYRAVNTAFRSGDATALDRIVAPNLAFHSPSPGMPPNRAGLERLLTSVHDTLPALQLRVEDMVSDGDRAVVRVAGSDGPGRFLGLTVAAAPSPWSQFDSFRIVDRQIVEMWSGGPAPILFQPATAAPLDLDRDPHAIALERLSASGGTRQEWGPFSGTRLLYVDEGTITVDLSPAAPHAQDTNRNGQAPQTPIAPSAPVVVTAGEVMAFPDGSRYTLRHGVTDTGVVAFTIAFPHFHYTGPHQPQEPTAAGATQVDLGVIQRESDAARLLDPRAGVTVSPGRVLLPPGANIAFQEAEGYLFVVVETGTLVLAREGGVMSLDRLNTGGRGIIRPGEPFTLHNLGDDTATVFLVTVLPRSPRAIPAS